MRFRLSRSKMYFVVGSMLYIAVGVIALCKIDCSRLLYDTMLIMATIMTLYSVIPRLVRRS